MAVEETITQDMQASASDTDTVIVKRDADATADTQLPEQNKDVQDTVVPETPTEPEVPTVREVPVSNDRQEQLYNFVETAGIDAEATERALIETGKLPDDVQAKLKEVHGDAVGQMVIDGILEQKAALEKVTAAQDKAMFKHVEDAFVGVTEQSGKETWNELKTWASENLKDHKAELNEMLAKGGMSAKAAIDFMVTQFKGSDSFTQPAGLEAGDNLSNDHVVAPMTRSDYTTELDKLLDSGKSYDSPEVKALQARRTKQLRRGG